MQATHSLIKIQFNNTHTHTQTLSAPCKAAILGVGSVLVVMIAPDAFSSANSSKDISPVSLDEVLSENNTQAKFR
jgi:hypothetical protein